MNFKIYTGDVNERLLDDAVTVITEEPPIGIVTASPYQGNKAMQYVFFEHKTRKVFDKETQSIAIVPDSQYTLKSASLISTSFPSLFMMTGNTAGISAFADVLSKKGVKLTEYSVDLNDFSSWLINYSRFEMSAMYVKDVELDEYTVDGKLSYIHDSVNKPMFEQDVTKLKIKTLSKPSITFTINQNGVVSVKNNRFNNLCELLYHYIEAAGEQS